MGVTGDLLIDLQSQCKCSTTGLAGDAGLRAVTHGVEEVFEFEAQRLGAGEIGLLQGETGGGMPGLESRDCGGGGWVLHRLPGPRRDRR